MTDRKRIWDFIEENEMHFMNIYQSQGRTNLGNYFLEYLQKKKADRENKSQHLLLPVSQEPQYNPPLQNQYHMQPPHMNIPQQNLNMNPPSHGFPAPQDKSMYPGKQQYFDPNINKQQYIPPLPGQNFQGKQFPPQMPGHMNQYQPTPQTQGYPQNPQFNPQMPVNQINPNYHYQPNPNQPQQFHPGQYHHQNQYHPQYQQHHQQQHHPRPHMQNQPHHPHQMFQPPHFHMQQGQIPPQMHNPNYPQMGSKPEDPNTQQPFNQQNQPNRPMQYNPQPMNPQYQETMNQPPLHQNPQNRYNYPKVDNPNQMDGKNPPNFQQGEPSQFPYNTPPPSISQQSTTTGSLAQSATSTPVPISKKEMMIEEPKINRSFPEGQNLPNQPPINKDIKHENVQKNDEKIEKPNQPSSSEFKSPSNLVGNKLVPELKKTKEDFHQNSQRKVESLVPEKAQKEEENKEQENRKSFWSVVKSRQRSNVGEKVEATKLPEIKQTPVIERKPKEITKNPLEAQVFNKSKLLEKFGIFKERGSKKTELQGDMDKLFSIFEFHTEKAVTPHKSVRDIVNPPLKETLKTLNELLASTE